MAKRVLTPFAIINGISMSADITGAPTNIQYLDNLGLQINVTGSPVGTFTVQVSNDYQPALSDQTYPVNAGNWVTLPISPALAVTTATVLYVDLNQLGAAWIRVIYTRASGSGTCTAWITGKSLSG